MCLEKTDIWYIFDYYILWLSYISMIKHWNKSLIIWIKVTDYLLPPIRILVFNIASVLWVECNILSKNVFMLLILVFTRYKKKDWYFYQSLMCDFNCFWCAMCRIMWLYSSSSSSVSSSSSSLSFKISSSSISLSLQKLTKKSTVSSHEK